MLTVIGHLDLAAQKTDSLKYSTLEEVSLQTKSILNKTNTNANKINIGFMESSQIYNSVSSVVLEKQIATSIEDAMRNIPGVIKLWDATGRTDGGSFFTSRGFYTSVRARNGLANIAATNVDMSNIDRVEVIKGPSATLFGSIIPSYGGVINRITKKPMFLNASSISLAAGGDKFFRGQLDLNYKLTDNWAGRLNAAWQNQDSWQDQGNQKTYLVAPAFRFKPNEKLIIDLEGEFTGSDASSTGGNYVFFPTPAFINSSLASALQSMGLPQANIDYIIANAPKTFTEAFGTNRIDELNLDYDRSFSNDDVCFKSNTASAFADVHYKISNNWLSQTSITYSNTTNSGYMAYQCLLPNYLISLAQSIQTGVPDYGTPGHDYIARMVMSPTGHASNFQIQQNFVSDYSFGKYKRNRAVIGLDYSNFVSDIVYNRFYGSLAGLPFPDVFDVVPVSGGAPNDDDFNLANINAAYAANTPYNIDYK